MIAASTSAIPDALLIALAAVTFPLMVGLLAWIVRELSRTSAVLTKLEERSEDHGRRITNLEQNVVERNRYT